MSGYPRVYDSASSSGSSGSSSSGLMVFGLVIGALLLVPLLVVCGSSSSGGNDSVLSSTSETEGETGSAADLVRQAAAGIVSADNTTATDAAETAVLDTVAEPETYTVQAGDSLWAIANQFGITVEALQSANNIGDAAAIDVGQVLTIPAAPAASGAANDTNAAGGTTGTAGSAQDDTGGAVAAGE